MEPIVGRGFGENHTADGALLDQLFGAGHLRIHPAIVGDAQGAARIGGRLLHGAGFRIVHRHGFFAEHVLAGAPCLNSLRGMQKNGGRDVHGIGL